MKMDADHVSKPRLPIFIFLWLQAISAVAIWLFLFYRFNQSGRHLSTGSETASFLVHGVTFTLMAITGMYILARSSKNTPSVYYALYIIVWANTEGLHFVNKINGFGTFGEYLYNVEYALVFVTGIKLAQEFPKHLKTRSLVTMYGRTATGRFLLRPLTWLLQKNRTWYIILPLSLLLTFLIDRTYVKLYSVGLISLFLLYIWAQHLSITPRQSKLVYWVIWAAVCQLFVSLFYFLVLLYDIDRFTYIEDGLNIIGCMTALVATVMIVYFSDLLDAGLILRKTLLYGILFFIVAAVFGTLEHYVIHKISHWLHLNDVYVVSLFSAIIGMTIHPLKMKLEHTIKKIDKRHAMLRVVAT